MGAGPSLSCLLISVSRRLIPELMGPGYSLDQDQPTNFGMHLTG